MFDAHCHLDRAPEPAKDLIERAHDQGVSKMLIAGVDPEGWSAQNKLATDSVLMAWGLHPWAVAAQPDQVNACLLALENMLARPPVPVVALGETGLDYSRRIDPLSRTHQSIAFRAQIRLATQFQLPLVLHIVAAHADALEILRSEALPLTPGMVHAFSGSAEIAAQYVDLGFHISFCGTVVDPNRRKLRAAAASIAADRLLVETDSPDQTPITRRPAPNEPAFLIDVIAAIAEIRREAEAEVAKTTTDNANRLFCPNHHE